MNLTQVRILIAAIFVLIIAGIVMYFRMDIEKIMTGSSKKDEVKSKIATNQGPNFPTPYPRKVRAAMFVDGYTVSVQNELDLISALEEMNIFGRSYVSDGKQTTGQQPLEEVSLAIRNTPPPDGRKPDYGKFTYVYLASGVIQVNFVLDNSQLSDPKIGDELLHEMIGAVYKSVYKDVTSQQVDDATDKAYNSLKDKNDNYIVLKKK